MRLPFATGSEHRRLVICPTAQPPDRCDLRTLWDAVAALLAADRGTDRTVRPDPFDDKPLAL